MDLLRTVQDERGGLADDELGSGEHDTVRSNHADLAGDSACGHRGRDLIRRGCLAGACRDTGRDVEVRGADPSEGHRGATGEVETEDGDLCADIGRSGKEAGVGLVVLLVSEDGHQAVRGVADTALVEHLHTPESHAKGTGLRLVLGLQVCDLRGDLLIALAPGMSTPSGV